ncbi:hypothetical protein RhiJN_09656 [Ceratobasidium sp. AG-Ba]|nr:hypothetical protein RhiJN_09656 [Ceratobasidium sp. AG-Ba]QRW10415.1 hypothetical protein RhiLY_09414 [Ceratobasidium sp. AG-Ba]
MNISKRTRRAPSGGQRDFSQQDIGAYDPHDPQLQNAPRNHNIFPGGFGTSDQSRNPPVEFTLPHLEDVLIKQHEPNDYVEPIYVASARYCKEYDRPQHEFIIIIVETEDLPKFRNFIILDRAVSSQGERIERELLPIISSSLYSPKVKNRFRVSYDGTLKNLVSHCKFSRYAVLETLQFQPKVFPFYEMVTISRTASEVERSHALWSDQCQWFTSSVWDSIRYFLPKAIHTQAPAKTDSNTRGRSGNFFRQRLDFQELNTIFGQVNRDIQLIRRDFIKFQKNQQDSGLPQEQERDRLLEELDALKEQKLRRATT